MPGLEEDREYFHNTNGNTIKTKKNPVTEMSNSGALSFAKVFLYMFVYLAITTAVAFGLGYVIATSYANSGGSEQVLNVYLGILIGAAVAMIIMMLVINFVVIRGKHSVLIPSIIYAVLVGVLFSCLTIFIDWRVIGMAFGITCGIFLLMTGIALLTKGNMAPLAMMGIGLLIGGGILALLNWIIGSTTLFWIVSFVIFAAVMFISMFDVWRIKKIAENGQMDRNLSFYCAFIIYSDFINVFIRILYYLLIIFGKKN